MILYIQHYIDPCPRVSLTLKFNNRKTVDGYKTFFQFPELLGIIIEFNCFRFRENPYTIKQIIVDGLDIQVSVLTENEEAENGSFVLLTDYSKNKFYRKFPRISRTFDNIGIKRNYLVTNKSKVFIWFHAQ